METESVGTLSKFVDIEWKKSKPLMYGFVVVLFGEGLVDEKLKASKLVVSCLFFQNFFPGFYIYIQPLKRRF